MTESRRFHVDISRTGSRSTFGEIRVMKAGVEKPLAMVSGVAVYTEIGQRSLKLPIDPALAAYANGQVDGSICRADRHGPVTLAETSAVLN
jgi:hypothetical protein